MKTEFIYCIENSWLEVSNCRNVYISFPQRITYTKFESLKQILERQRIIHSTNSESIHFDIVYDALQEFYLKWGIEGKIVDTITGTLLY